MRKTEEILNGQSLPIFLMKCRDDFKYFAENLLQFTSTGEKIKIYPFQEKWILRAERHKRIIIESGTGSSKTEVIGAMYPIWKMLKGKNLRILLISKTLEQSGSNILSRIKRYIDDNDLLTELFVPDGHKDSWNATEIKLEGGHWVKNVPYNVNIRGYRAHLAICDEIDSYEDPNIFFEHVLSRLYPDGQCIGISTPTGPTKIIGQLKEKQKAGILDGWTFISTPYLVDDYGEPAKIENQEDIKKYKSIWPENWSVDKLYSRWGEQGKANWLRNYMVICVGEIDDAIFPMENIVRSYDYKRGFDENMNPEAMYFIGADFAISEGPRADFDAYIVVEKLRDQYIIKTMETHKGWQRPQKVNRLLELYRRFDSPTGSYLVVDESNMGTMVMNDLRSLGIPVIGQSFQSSARTKILITLGSVFSGKSLIIPRNPEANDECVPLSELLTNQLVGFKRKSSENSGNRDLIASKAAHDDLAMALAMAINEAVQHIEMDLMPIS